MLFGVPHLEGVAHLFPTYIVAADSQIMWNHCEIHQSVQHLKGDRCGTPLNALFPPSPLFSLSSEFKIPCDRWNDRKQRNLFCSYF
jgi:hypothetical protein